MLVQGKEVKRRDSKTGLVSQAATSSPPPSITPLYMLAVAGLQTCSSQSDMVVIVRHGWHSQIAILVTCTRNS